MSIIDDFFFFFKWAFNWIMDVLCYLLDASAALALRQNFEIDNSWHLL